MLQERPGCYVRLGNGSEGHGSCVVHNPATTSTTMPFPSAPASGRPWWSRSCLPSAVEIPSRGVDMIDSSAGLRFSPAFYDETGQTLKL